MGFLKVVGFPNLGIDNFNINPVAIENFLGIKGLDIYWYAIIITAGIVLGFLYALNIASKHGISKDDLTDFALFAVPVSVICARIYYVVFSFDEFDSFSDMINIRNGGLAILGAVIGGIITAVIFCKVKKLNFLALADVCVVALLIGQLIGRWGNFMNVEAFGSLVSDDFLFGMKIKISEISYDVRQNLGISFGDGFVSVHPTFLYESVWNLAGFAFLAFYNKRKKFNGEMFLMYLSWYGLGRFMVEALRTDSLMIGKTGLRVSQLVSLAAFVVGVTALGILYFKFKKNKLPEIFCIKEGRKNMAKIMDGKLVSKTVREKIREEVSELKNKGITPGLAVIIVGENPASKVYVANKEKACEELGIYSEKYALPEETTQEELLELIEKLNKDDRIDGILCQLPLPKHIDEKVVINNIDYQKDVDAFHPVNVGKIMIGDFDFLPCTPAGVMEILKYYDVDVCGKECVVIGRSNIVGKPQAMLLLHNNATVTICHSRTKDLKEVTKRADVLISAVGISDFVTKDMVKEGAVVVDVGMNRNKEGKLCGDVCFDEVSEIASMITPVPGGVGPMTITMLMKNTLKAAKLHNKID